ncbi:unnamed protein product [Soboliphyme baturini]|uniref:Uncharacterized protein n=1 Tax=Soboliphyme baturini TaxID=241478 RepID=A0A183ILJ4_9BILA|nr:unnamed protein product [Soboliphyme baturini]
MMEPNEFGRNLRVIAQHLDSRARTAKAFNDRIPASCTLSFPVLFLDHAQKCSNLECCVVLLRIAMHPYSNHALTVCKILGRPDQARRDHAVMRKIADSRHRMRRRSDSVSYCCDDIPSAVTRLPSPVTRHCRRLSSRVPRSNDKGRGSNRGE